MKIKNVLFSLLFASTANVTLADAAYTAYDKMDFGYNACNVQWGPLQSGVEEADMVAMATQANAYGFTYHPTLKYGKVMTGKYPTGCESPSNESWPLFLSRARSYKAMDFGFNSCDIQWGPLQVGVNEADMITLAIEANAEGFTYHPALNYGQVIVGAYPKGCESPSNESWPLYLSETRLYNQMSFGFNTCDVEWGPLQVGVSESDMKMIAAGADAEGFTYHPALQYGKVLIGAYPTGCESPSNQSWPLYLSE